MKAVHEQEAKYYAGAYNRKYEFNLSTLEKGGKLIIDIPLDTPGARKEIGIFVSKFKSINGLDWKTKVALEGPNTVSIYRLDG